MTHEPTTPAEVAAAIEFLEYVDGDIHRLEHYEVLARRVKELEAENLQLNCSLNGVRLPQVGWKSGLTFEEIEEQLAAAETSIAEGDIDAIADLYTARSTQRSQPMTEASEAAERCVNSMWSAEDRARAGYIVALNYLVEHPTDDNKPTTNEWLHAVLRQNDVICGWDNETFEFTFRGNHHYKTPPKRTRGDVRRLYLELGFPLKEVENESTTG